MHYNPRHHPAFDLPSSSSSLSSTSSSTTAASHDSPLTPKAILQTHRHYQHESVQAKLPLTFTIPRQFPQKYRQIQPASEHDDPWYPSICLDGRQSCNTSSHLRQTSYRSSTAAAATGTIPVPGPRSSSIKFISAPLATLSLPDPPRRAPPPVPTGLTAFVTCTTSPLDDVENRHHSMAQSSTSSKPTLPELKQYWPSSRHIVQCNRHPRQFLKPHEVFARKVSRTLQFGNNKPRYSYVKASEVRQQQQQEQQQLDSRIFGPNTRKRVRTMTPTTTGSHAFAGNIGATGSSSLMQGLVGWLSARIHSPRHSKKQKLPNTGEDQTVEEQQTLQQPMQQPMHQQQQGIPLFSRTPQCTQAGANHTISAPTIMQHNHCSSTQRTSLHQSSVETLRARETQAQEYARTIKALWKMVEEEERAYQLAVEQQEWTDEDTTTATTSEVGGDDRQHHHYGASGATASAAGATVHTGINDFWQWHSGARPAVQHQTRFGAGHLHYQERQAQKRMKDQKGQGADMSTIEEGIEEEAKPAVKERNGALLFEQQQQRLRPSDARDANLEEESGEEEQEEAQALYQLQMQYGHWHEHLLPPAQIRSRCHTASTTAEYQYGNSSHQHQEAYNSCEANIDPEEADAINSHFEMERALHSRVLLEEACFPTGVASENDENKQQEHESSSGSLTRAIRASVVRPRVVVLESENELDMASTKRRIQAQREQQQRQWNDW
ncbi:hypothetical protein BGW41_007625 [Actinomortierella wolfii]|nr:hypothetical protein BGW41_007625 [Actinomortierella wolfii]